MPLAVARQEAFSPMDRTTLRYLLAALAIPLTVAGIIAVQLAGSPSPTLRKKVEQPSEPAAPRIEPTGLKTRQPWTTSRLKGAPEPPAPWVAQPLFPHLKFRNPVALSVEPLDGSTPKRRLWVAEQGGRVLSFPMDRDCREATLALDVAALVTPARPGGEPSVQGNPQVDNTGVLGLEALYGLEFHPRFAENRYCYLTYVVRGEPGKQLPHGTRVSRFTVAATDPPTLDPASEQVVITWLQGGHNGGCLAFGPDGHLYISTGDGGFANPPDGLNSGQDLSNLLSCILRIDVDHPSDDRAYSIPADNPFVSLPNARGEIWCYGLRNPWKMSFDRGTGDLWVADVGWELWELVYRVQKGGNYGWSIVEGRQPVHPERKLGPTPILPPTIEIPHTDGVSITGGFVYRGRKYPELVGQYIFGDWETRRIWASRWDSATQSASAPVDVVEPTVRLVAFAEDPDGELLLLDYDDGAVLSLERNERYGKNVEFPRKLSETGLFQSTRNQQPSEGVIPFSVNVEQWVDGATADRWIALPQSTSVKFLAQRKAIAGSMFSSQQEFPADAVLVKTLSLPEDPPRPIETQVLHFDGKFWRGYSYAWNDDQTDALLVEPGGRESVVGANRGTWRFSSRVECARCHNQWAEYALAFNLRQLNREHDYPSGLDQQLRDNQLRTLSEIGVIELPRDDKSASLSTKRGKDLPASWYREHFPKFQAWETAASPASLDQQARSYLHVNCAHCHRVGGGGTASIELQAELPIEATKTLDVRPTQGAFDIADARIIAPGDPYRSTLFLRMSKTGSGRMPHIGSEQVDEQAVRAIHGWIRELPLRPHDAARFTELASLVDESPLPGSEVERQKEIVRRQDRENRRQRLIDELLATTSGAIYASERLRDKSLPSVIRDELLAAARKTESAAIRDLFEAWQPVEHRVQRLGSVIRPEQILALAGDVEQGKQLYHAKNGVQCRNCHRIGGQGGQLGPELDRVGVRYSRAQLLEHIVEPSKVIDPKYVGYIVQLDDGRVVTGLIVDRTDTELVIRDVTDKVTRLPIASVESLAPQRKSLMPDLLLRDLSIEQAANLLAYLTSLR
jgi:putative heme-binding domain-containing protein